jgi:hypothetical protein
MLSQNPETQFSLAPFIFKIFGYFPINSNSNSIHSDLLKIQSDNSTTTVSKIKSKISFSIYFSLFPLFITLSLSLAVVLLFVSNFNYLLSLPDEITQRVGKSTFYFTMTIKPTTHLFTAIFIKVGMFLKRSQISEIYFNIVALHCKLLQKHGFGVGNYIAQKKHQLRSKLNKEIVMFLVITFLLNADMLHKMSVEPKYNFINGFLIFIPVLLGYLHTIFALVIKYFLDWYLIVLIQIRVILKEAILSKENNILGESTFLSEITSSYLALHCQIGKFCKLFEFWITIDFSHSLFRIVFCSYFIASSFDIETFQRGIFLNDLTTVVLYFYLIAILCKRGSDLWNESEEVLRLYDEVKSSIQVKCF